VKHAQVSQEFLQSVFQNKKISSNGYDLEDGYYHIYAYDNLQSLSVDSKSYDGFPASTYFYPAGAIVYYNNGMVEIVDHNISINGQTGNNPYQWATIDALLRDNIELVILTGVAGSGKTFLSLAYALSKVENSQYNKIVLSRPKQTLERDEGFLPGGEDDKIMPYMMPFYDNARSMGASQDFQRMVNRGEDTFGITFQPLEKIKGRSFENTIVIVDEAEDMRYREIESLLTRLNNSKVIICGDIKQIDDKTFSKNNIPLTYAIQKFYGQDFVAHIDNPITSRKGKVTQFVIKNFSYEEYKKAN
jgi:predicted ribonuclease YlaK